MKKGQLKIITPVWAANIRVKRAGSNLIVTGEGRIPDPFEPRDLNPEQVSGVDIFRRFRRYGLRNLSGKELSRAAGIYQFADATTEEKLIEFIEEFGPVWGKIQSSQTEEDRTVTLTVAQHMKRLWREQEQFAALVLLVQQANKKRNTHSAEDCAAISVAMLDLELPLYALIFNNAYLDAAGSHREKAAAALPWAHRAICNVLNEYAPKLIPFDDAVIELPIVQDEGIRSAIYWRLRLDYLAKRSIGTCGNCDGHFPIYRRGAEGCSQPCRVAIRNTRYWQKNKAGINDGRRTQRSGRK